MTEVDAWRKELHRDFERPWPKRRFPSVRITGKPTIPDQSPKAAGEMNSVHQLSTNNHQPAQRQRPNYEAANRFLIKARRSTSSEA